MTVAERLAENNTISVAVVEAGGFYELDSGNFSQIPAYETLYADAPAAIDWEIYTTPQPVRPILCSDEVAKDSDVSSFSNWVAAPYTTRRENVLEDRRSPT